ncbi:nitrile hydratase accessory protein [Paracoccus sp. JM45]|jgi:nitrile hydratase accessory protein|uniref:nitrile hydratase accessory protein n=1 Tax=Paracoccus sp. JM45 TaxID=2283626 RepID=UPI000E6BA835|nr:nitrile hydratase accessory protein [Paracoccus sp. JM45]RJE78989.1 nitrile hydratase accessory protein [Paracoccus sp. JM45]
MTMLDLSILPDIALSGYEPAFDEPWQAQAFAMTVNLHQSGLFEWKEWANVLSTEVHSGIDRDYYLHWLRALERIVAMKHLATVSELGNCAKAWQEAAERTPHGETISL